MLRRCKLKRVGLWLRQQELHKLNTAMMQTFISLLDEMLANPAVGGFDSVGRDLMDRAEGWIPIAATASLERLKELFLNFHHLLNLARPEQARGELLRMLQQQADRRSATASSLTSEIALRKRSLAMAVRKVRDAGLKDIEKLCASAAAVGVAASGRAEAAATTDQGMTREKRRRGVGDGILVHCTEGGKETRCGGRYPGTLNHAPATVVPTPEKRQVSKGYAKRLKSFVAES